MNHTTASSDTIADTIAAAQNEKSLTHEAVDGHEVLDIERGDEKVREDGLDPKVQGSSDADFLSKKLVAILTVSFITFLSPLASSMPAPCVPSIASDFGTTNVYIEAFIVSGYLIVYVAGPLVIAPLSEIYGRRPLYLVCNFIFTVFDIACAGAPNFGSLILFRILAGIGGACPITLGAPSLGEMIPARDRGKAMAVWIFCPLLGPVIGPICGGYLCESTSWRWGFWVMTIAGGVVSVATAIFMSESYAYVILQRKTTKQQKETGKPNLRSILDTGRTPRDLFTFSIVRPIKMLFLSPIVFLLSLYNAAMYGYLYLLFTTFTQVYEGQYGFSSGASGLSCLGIGVGSLLGVIAAALVSDRLVAALAVRHGGEHKPEFRLPILFVAGFLIPAGLFWYGWSAYRQQPWIFPIVGTGMLGCGMVLNMMAIVTYLTEVGGLYAASALAANTVLRSLVGAFLPLAGPSLYDSLGINWGNSLLGFIALAVVPIPVLFYIY